MKTTGKIIKTMLEYSFFLYIFIALSASLSFAKDLKNKVAPDLIVSANILTLAANINSELLSISYNGVSIGNRPDFQIKGFDIEEKDVKEMEPLFGVGKTLTQMTQMFLKYFKVEDNSTEDPDTLSFFKSRVNTVTMDPDEFELNVSFFVGYDNRTNLKMDAIKIESYGLHTFVNAMYHYEKNELEFGLSSAHINKYLKNGMKLEFQANPSAGAGAVVLIMSL